MEKNGMRSAFVVGVVLIFVFGAFAPVIDSLNKNTIGTTSSSSVSKDMVESLKDTDDQKNIPSIKNRDTPPVPLSANDPWWNLEWLYRKEITINHTKVSTNLENFPVLINLTDGDLAGKAQSDGDDIVFINNATGTKLNHEIELYNSGTGRLVAWVNVTSLLSTVDTTLYMYYGNATASNQENIEGVWDSHFKMVQHLSETTGTHYDSTSFNNDGVPYGGVNQFAVGQIDGADEFDGSDDYVNCGTTIGQQYTNAISLSAWVKVPSALPTNVGFFHDGANGWTVPGFYSRIYSNGPPMLILGNGVSRDIQEFSTNLPLNRWCYISLVTDGVTKKLYIDGKLKESKTLSISGPFTASPSEECIIGWGYGDTEDFKGTLDEVRLSNIARNASWINTSYNNQYDPDMFIIIGSEETEAGEPIISAEYPENGATNEPIELNELMFNLHDTQGDLMDFTVITRPDIGSADVSGVSNGTYTIPISNLIMSTTYTWYVNVTDGLHWTNKTYTFTTGFNLDVWKYWKKITVNKQQIEDNCRIYAVLSDNLPNGLLQNDLIDAPNSLERLSAFINIDGWGIGYYSQYIGSATIYRGAQRAINDPEYENVVQQINATEPKITLAHIRNCQAGCCCHECGTIDDPHPFMRVKNGKTWTFIHNGFVHESIVLPLLGDYLTHNPLNCSGVCPDDQHCDSEMFFLLLLKYIENNSWHVTNGLVEGLNALLNAGETGGLNFVLSNGEKMWAFRRHQLSTHTLYYLDDISEGYAAVASEYPSSTQGNWIAIDDYQLIQFSNHTDPLIINVLNHTLVPDLRDFPVLIDIMDTDLASKAQSDGDDIVFTDVYKNKLNHEIELFNYTTGHLIAWIRLPLLFMNQEEDLYMFYGNQYAENQQNVSGVWNTHYMVVHHLEETSGALFDSTGNNNDGVPQNGVVLNVSGRIDGAVSFDGADDYVSIADSPTLDGDGAWSEMTMETWVKTDVNQTQRIILAKWGPTSSRSYQLGINSNGNTQLFAAIDNGEYLETVYSDVAPLKPGVWYHVAATYKNGVLNLYINGILEANRLNTGGNIRGSADSFKMGARNPTPERFFDGSIDEVRISNVARCSNWTLLSYRNQNNTTMFISVGPEEERGIHITTLTEQWNFVSVPYNHTINKADLTIVSGATEYAWANATSAGIILGFCYEWNRGTQSYQLSDSLKPGQGYWVYAYAACELWLKNVTVLDPDTYITKLSMLWNVIGVPYEESVEQENLIVQYNGADYNWSQATTSNNPTGSPLILGFIYNWTRSSQTYTLSNTLPSRHACWMYAYKFCTIKQ